MRPLLVLALAFSCWLAAAADSRTTDIRATGMVRGALGGGASIGSNSSGHLIRQTSIDGVRLGLHRKEYLRLYGGKATRGGRGVVLELRHPKVSVYMSALEDSGIAILTESRRDHTPQGIGPCSTLRAFRRVYPHARETSDRDVYKMGDDLFFGFQGGRVLSVLLQRETYPVVVVGSVVIGGSPDTRCQ
jgi:hypothetical protein